MGDAITLPPDIDFYNDDALLERLTAGIAKSGRQVAFLVGSALTAPPSPGHPGVPGVDGIIELIKQEFDEDRQRELSNALIGQENRYQEAFRFLYGRRGPEAANAIIRRAVALARSRSEQIAYQLNAATIDEACRAFDADTAGWSLTPGVEALGELAAKYPEKFGRTILTTNFDPLIGAAISAAGGTCFRTVVHRDGNLGQTDGEGVHVVHLHGYWYGSDTLHTPRQLNQARPQLRASLAHLIRDRIVVVMAYGGWDDAFTQALMDVVLDDNAYPEVIWCFRQSPPTIRSRLLDTLTPGINRGRVSLYAGIDCNVVIPSLVKLWEARERPAAVHRPIVPQAEPEPHPYAARPAAPWLRSHLLNADADRPPKIEFYVGRDDSLVELETTPFKIAFITGIGGQGKSALAASYFNASVAAVSFDYRLWRDCKEQSELFEDHLSHLIEALNDGRVAGGELSKQPIAVLAELFCSLTEDLRLLVIFDNVDHYVDLEIGRLTGAAGEFVTCFLSRPSNARLIFTCRPQIADPNPNVLSCRLGGLDLTATIELFALRHANASEVSIARAHELTSGHAFWLDLLAAQVANRTPPVALDNMLSSISAGTGEIPHTTLRSIWQSLREREQLVLQALAETLRPTSALQLSDYLGSRLRYNQMSRAIKILRDLNLLVVKSLDGGEDGFELHPVIRAFIRTIFKRAERATFINAILAVYAAFFGVHRDELGKRPHPNTVKRWIEGAELCINAGNFAGAFVRLDEVRITMRRGEPPGDFVRVVELLLSSVETTDWSSFQGFDKVFREYHRLITNLGRTETAGEALGKYHETLSGKDARYINYCEMNAYLHWKNRNFPGAIKWGTEGTELKKGSGVDTEFSSEHTLALAQRDSGAIDPALKFFLEDVSIEDVLDQSQPDTDRGEAFYGNIGRCLQLMGQTDSALICYRKSAQLIEHSHEYTDVENQAYIRQWIGELLLKKEEPAAALSFLTAAVHKWASVSPPESERMRRYVEKQATSWDATIPHPESAEAFVLKWIDSR